MGGKVNSKKAAGNARKAEEAAKKQAAADLQQSKQEDAEWSKGAKSTAKQYVIISPLNTPFRAFVSGDLAGICYADECGPAIQRSSESQGA